MRTRLYLAASVAGSIVAGIFACSNDNGSYQPLPVYNPDASSTVDSAAPAPVDAAPTSDVSAPDSATDAADAADAKAIDADAGALPLNGCGEADFADADYTADGASRIIRFPNDGIPGPYDPQCMRIKVGESVRWVGNFLAHPLTAQDTNPNNPIPQVDDAGPDGSVTVGFPEAGWFGYACQVHGSMKGAIEVQP